MWMVSIILQLFYMYGKNKNKNLTSVQNQTSVVQFVANNYIDCSIPALFHNV
jgi:hypothetical protein